VQYAHRSPAARPVGGFFEHYFSVIYWPATGVGIILGVGAFVSLLFFFPTILEIAVPSGGSLEARIGPGWLASAGDFILKALFVLGAPAGAVLPLFLLFVLAPAALAYLGGLVSVFVIGLPIGLVLWLCKMAITDTEFNIRRLGSANVKSVMGAAARLGESADPRAVEPLLCLQDHADRDVQNAGWQALLRLGEITSERIRDLIEQGTVGSEAIVDLLHALAKQGAYNSAWSGLVPLLGHSSAAVREAAESTLCVEWSPENVRRTYGAVPDPNLIEAAAGFGEIGVGPLSNALEGRGRPEAATALARIGGPRATAKLAEALSHRDSRVRKAAADGLFTLGWEPGDGEQRVAYMIARADLTEVVALGPAAVDGLLQVLTLARDESTGMACTALGSIGDERAIKPLIGLLCSEIEYSRRDSSYRSAAARDTTLEISAAGAIERFGIKAVRPLLDRIDVWIGARQAVRDSLIAFLAQTGDHQVVEPLSRCLGYTTEMTQLEAALTSFGVVAVPVLLHLAAHTYFGAAITNVLDQIGWSTVRAALEDTGSGASEATSILLDKIGYVGNPTPDVSITFLKLTQRLHRALARQDAEYIQVPSTLSLLEGALSAKQGNGDFGLVIHGPVLHTESYQTCLHWDYDNCGQHTVCETVVDALGSLEVCPA
jgi:HEAT repeat protein